MSEYSIQVAEDKKYISPLDENISYIFNIIKSFNIYEVKKLNYSGCSYDIIYKIKKHDIYRGIQVKILKERMDRVDTWNIELVDKNKNKTLLVLLNKDKNRFGLIFREDCPQKALGLSFSTNYTKYEENKFINLKKFIQYLFNYIPFSNGYDEKENIIKNKEMSNQQKENAKRNRSNVKTGDETEMYIFNILKNFNNNLLTPLFEVKHIGYSGNKFDILYQIDREDAIRGIQIKTLVKGQKINSWLISLDKCKYEKDTLLVLVNPARDRFGLIFYGECRKSGLGLFFATNLTKYEKNKFIDVELFKKELYIRMKKSTIYNENNSFTEPQKKEHNMLIKLKEKCEELNIDFNLNNTASNEIDCFINKYRIQCKFSSNNFEHKNYLIHITKSRHKYYNNNSKIYFFIFQISANINNFYIIPMQDMIDMGYITEDDKKGQSALRIAPISNNKEHWSKFYMDKFSYLMIEKKIIRPFSILPSSVKKYLLIKKYIKNDQLTKLIKAYL
jgi:hypothetical protein